jgi:hypothetical protein
LTPYLKHKTFESIQTKLKSNGMATVADKGIFGHSSHPTIQIFLQENNFQSSTIDATKIFQTQTRKTVNTSMTLIPHEIKRKYINQNPSAPTTKGPINLPNLF